MAGVTMNRGALIVLCGATIVVAAMALIVAGYLFNTYSNATIIVAGLATLIVAASIAIPYWAAQRMCARKGQRLAAARQD
jgi:protein-S-isoprenylcysteine O-methyltransferase Ste14